MNKIFFYSFLFLSVLIISFSGNCQDTAKYKSFYYFQFNTTKNVDVLSDSINFNDFIIFKVSNYHKKKNYVKVAIYFISELKQIKNLNRSYYFVMFNHILYGDLWNPELIDYTTREKLISYGRDNDLEKNVIYFDRFDDVKNDCSIFQKSSAWYLSNKAAENYFIFRTNFDGILIKDDIKIKGNKKIKVKSIKILIPFTRYLPLLEVKESELTKYPFLKKRLISPCN